MTEDEYNFDHDLYLLCLFSEIYKQAQLASHTYELIQKPYDWPNDRKTIYSYVEEAQKKKEEFIAHLLAKWEVKRKPPKNQND